MFRMLVFGIMMVSAAGAAPLNAPFHYQGTHYRLTVFPSGRLENCSTGRMKLFSSLELYGNYEHPGEEYDSRMFQASAQASSRLEKTGGNQFRLISAGVLGNGKIRDAAAFEQTTELEPAGFRVRWRVTLKVPLKTRSGIFSSLMHGPVESMIDRGIVAGSQRDQVITIPATCERNKGLYKYGVGILWFSLPETILNVVAGEKSAMTVIDCRSWGEPLFRLDFSQISVWKNDLEEYPAGTVWEWSVAFRFEPYED